MISTLVWGVLLGFNVVGLDLANVSACIKKYSLIYCFFREQFAFMDLLLHFGMPITSTSAIQVKNINHFKGKPKHYCIRIKRWIEKTSSRDVIRPPSQFHAWIC